jgi:glycosyltransferase involved in cell wall biosynthesis
MNAPLRLLVDFGVAAPSPALLARVGALVAAGFHIDILSVAPCALEGVRTHIAPASDDAIAKALRARIANECAPDALLLAGPGALAPDQSAARFAFAFKAAAPAALLGACDLVFDENDDVAACLRAFKAEGAARKQRPLPGALRNPQGFEQEVARALAQTAPDKRAGLAQAAAEAALAACPQLYARRRLLIDVTMTADENRKTGIQRVVRKMTEAWHADPHCPFIPVAVRLRDNRLWVCESFVVEQTGATQVVADAPYHVRAGDILLMHDSAWFDFARLSPVFAAVRAAGGCVYTTLYDLIPVLDRGAAAPSMTQIYIDWLRAVLVESDGIIAISRTVAEQLIEFLESWRWPARAGLKIGYAHIGSDFAPAAHPQPSPAMQAAFADSAPAYLVVGTIEPRKGHVFALEAFEKLWAQGFVGRLIFVGRPGWNVAQLEARMRAHAQKGTKFFWFDDCGDEDLAYAYRNAAAILAPAYAEGYGLPLSEAAILGKPVLCSDIPVFREVGGAGAIYFRVNDAEDLARAVQGFADGALTAKPDAIARIGWLEATRRWSALMSQDDWLARRP